MNYTVLLDETAQNIRLDVYSVDGQLVMEKYFYGTSAFGFDLSYCSRGVYVVKVAYGGKVFTQKVVQ